MSLSIVIHVLYRIYASSFSFIPPPECFLSLVRGLLPQVMRPGRLEVSIELCSRPAQRCLSPTCSWTTLVSSSPSAFSSHLFSSSVRPSSSPALLSSSSPAPLSSSSSPVPSSSSSPASSSSPSSSSRLS